MSFSSLNFSVSPKNQLLFSSIRHAIYKEVSMNEWMKGYNFKQNYYCYSNKSIALMKCVDIWIKQNLSH